MTSETQNPKIQDVVAAKISNAGEKVRETVINKLADIEISRRVELITVAIGRLDNLAKDLKKINRPDSAHYDGAGNKIEVTTEKRYQEIAKAKGAIKKIEDALNAALETNSEESYKKLQEACGNQKQEQKEESKDGQ